MRIGELARRAGVTTRAIRHYERIGLLPDAHRTEAGYRVYTEDARDRLAFVRAAQAVGLTLGEIGEVIAFRDRGETPCAHVLALVERRAAELGSRIEEMQAAACGARIACREGVAPGSRRLLGGRRLPHHRAAARRRLRFGSPVAAPGGPRRTA